MEIGKALKIITDEVEYVDPFCLYSRLADLVRSDYKERDKLKLMFKIDKRLSLVGRLTKGGIDEVESIKGEAETIGDLCDEATFCDIVDTVASALIEGYALPEPIESASDEPTEPDGSDEFDYGYVEEGPSVADCLGDKNRLMQFTKAQLKQYCFEQGFRGYGSLKKEDLVKFIMNGGKLKHSLAKNAPTIANNSTYSYNYHSSALPFIIIGAIVAAIVIAGIICLIVFAKQIRWYQWQHIIGSIGGLIVCAIGGLFVGCLGYLLDEVIMTDFDGYYMAVPIVLAILAVVNIVLSFVYGSAYRIIFFWLSGYCLLASAISAFLVFDEDETGAGVFSVIDAIVVAVALATQILIQVL